MEEVDIGDRGIERDDFFFILSVPRRQGAIYLLEEYRGEISLKDMATNIASRENDKPEEEIEYLEYKRAYSSLQQNHIPSLEDLRVVSKNDGDILKGDKFEVFSKYLPDDILRSLPEYQEELDEITGVYKPENKRNQN